MHILHDDMMQVISMFFKFSMLIRFFFINDTNETNCLLIGSTKNGDEHKHSCSSPFLNCYNFIVFYT